jgi:tetratricopeptide (TPR) repeat protein
MRRLIAAEEAYRQIAAEWPKRPEGHMGLAVVHRHQGRLRKALEAARMALKAGPNIPDNAYIFGVIVDEMGATSAHPTGMAKLLEEARTQLRRAGKTLKEQPDIDYRLGRICLLIRRYDEARAALERAVSATPTRTVAWLALSDARMRTGDTDGAIQAARTARQTGPVDVNARIALGKALLLKKDRKSLEEATEVLKEAVSLNPDSFEAMQRLGTALLRLNRLEESGAIFEDAMKLNPSDPYPPQQLSTIYQRTGNLDLAKQAAQRGSALATNQSLLRQLQRTASTHPENGLVHRALADRYRELGWWGPAADEYELALERLPNDARSKAGLAEVRKMQAQRQSE